MYLIIIFLVYILGWGVVGNRDTVSHNLAFIGILGVAKRDARPLLSRSHRCLTCDIGV